MAQDAATLLVRIEATTMQLRKELAAADRAVSGSSAKIDKELGLVDKAFSRMGLNAEQSRKAIGSAMAGITAAAAGGVAGLGALVVSTANSAREIQNLSQVANASTTEFQRYAVGAKTVGVEQEKLADILKDVNDRVGDFLTTGGGEMKDFFENIAPRIGVTAEQFRKLSGPQSLQLFYNSLEKANLSQAEMTFYMESMADETTALIPLLRDGGAGFTAMADEAERLGLVMSEKTLKQFDQFNAQMDTAKMAAGGFGTQIATEALPALSELNGLLIDFAQDSEAASVIGDALGVVLKGVATVAIGLSTTFANLGRAIGGLAAAASAAASMEFAQASSIIDQFTADNEAATAQAEQRIKKLWTGEYADAGKRAVEVNRTVSESSVQLGAAAKKSADDQKKAIDEKLKSLDALVAKYDPAAKAQAAYDAGIKLADEALKNNTYTTEQYQKVVQGLYTDLNKPIWDKHNKAADKAAAAIKKIDDQLQSVRDRLDPAGKAARDFADEQDFLKKAVDEGRLSLEEYNKLLPLLGKEYEENTRATSDWAKWTEGALDRVDGAFADAWRNIGDGFDGFRDSLTNAFKQMLAELAHMAITKPIIMQIGAAMGIGGGTQGNNGIWGSLLGGSGGSGGSAGGMNWGQMLNYGQSAYSAITGVGPAVLAGWQSGGIGGALSGGAGYYGNLLSGAASTVGGWLGLGGASAGAGAAAGTGFGLGGSLVSGGVGSATYAAGAGGIGSAISGALSSMASMWYLAPIIGAWQSGKLYDAGVRPDAGEMWESTQGNKLGQIGNVLPTLQSKFFEGLDKTLEPVVGGKIAAMITGSTFHQALWGGINKKLFGGAWEQKAAGIALSGTGGDFLGQQYIFSKKDGGLFGSDKKKTEYSEMDASLARALGKRFDEVTESALTIFDSFGFDVGDNALDGLNVKKAHIRTDSKKKQEQLQENIDKWFGTVGNASTDLIGGGLVSGFASRITEATSETLGAALEAAGAQLTDKQMKGLSGLSGAKLTRKLSSMVGAELAAQISGSVDEARAAVFEQLTTLDADMASSLSGLSGKKLTAELEKLTGFGKNAYESLAELAGKLEAVNATFELLNLTVYESSLGGAKLAEDLVAIAGGLESLATSTQTYYDAFFSAEEKLEDTINGIKGAFEDADLELAGSRDAYREMVEDIDLTTEAGREMFATMMALSGQAAQYYSILEQEALAAYQALQANIATYYEQFTTAGEKADDMLANVTASFEALELSLPSSRDGFRAVVDGLDTSTEAGQRMFQTLMSVAGAADAYYDILEARAAEAQAAAQAQAAAAEAAAQAQAAAAEAAARAQADLLANTANAAMAASSGAISALSKAIDAEKSAVTSAYQSQADAIEAAMDRASEAVSDMRGVADTLRSAVNGLRLESDQYSAQSRRNAQSLIGQTLSSGGRVQMTAQLERALDTVSESSENLFGSFEDYARDYWQTYFAIESLADKADDQLTAEERTVKALEGQLDQAQRYHDAELERLDGMVDGAQAQLDALLGINTGVLSVEAALAVVASSIGALKQLQNANSSITSVTGLGGVKRQVNSEGYLLDENGEYMQLFGEALRVIGNKVIGGAGSSLNIGADGQLSWGAGDYEKWAKEAGIPGFASGGLHSGGLRLVGENGPELEVTGPSRIYNASQTAAMLGGGGDAAAEVRALRTAIHTDLQSIAKHTMNTAKRLDTVERMVEDWDINGLPKERATA